MDLPECNGKKRVPDKSRKLKGHKNKAKRIPIPRSGSLLLHKKTSRQVVAINPKGKIVYCHICLKCKKNKRLIHFPIENRKEKTIVESTCKQCRLENAKKKRLKRRKAKRKLSVSGPVKDDGIYGFEHVPIKLKTRINPPYFGKSRIVKSRLVRDKTSEFTTQDMDCI